MGMLAGTALAEFSLWSLASLPEKTHRVNTSLKIVSENFVCECLSILGIFNLHHFHPFNSSLTHLTPKFMSSSFFFNRIPLIQLVLPV